MFTFELLNEIGYLLAGEIDDAMRSQLEDLGAKVSDAIHDREILLKNLATGCIVYCQRYEENFLRLVDEFVVLSGYVYDANGNLAFTNILGGTETGHFKPLSTFDQVNFDV